jgi:hypothetical protein
VDYADGGTLALAVAGVVGAVVAVSWAVVVGFGLFSSFMRGDGDDYE